MKRSLGLQMLLLLSIFNTNGSGQAFKTNKASSKIGSQQDPESNTRNMTSDGLSDFLTLSQNHNNRYIDKTHFIKEVMSNLLCLLIISRPPRFGKSLMLSTLQYFLDIRYTSSDATIEAFKGRRIMKISDQKFLEKHMNKYPIIRLDFSHIKSTTFQENYRKIKAVIGNAFRYHSQDLLDGRGNVNINRTLYKRLMAGTANEEEFQGSIRCLSEWLAQSSGAYPILLVDEYDAPIQAALENGHLKEMKAFVLPFYWHTLKANDYYRKAVITGVTHVHCGVLTGVLATVSTILDTRYPEFFGFTRTEVQELVMRSGKGCEAIRYVDKMLNGYTFGRSTIFNPWSVTKYLFDDQTEPWSAGISQGTFERFILGHGLYPILTIQRLLAGEFVTKEVLRQLFDPAEGGEESAYWAYLLQLGYLSLTKRDKDIRLTDPVGNFTLRIPNLEVARVLRTILYERSWRLKIKVPKYEDLIDDLVTGEFSRVRSAIQKYASKAGPFFKTGGKRGMWRKKDFDPDVWVEYVTQILSGVERQYRTTLEVVRQPQRVLVRIMPGPRGGTPVRVAVERTTLVRTTWQRLKFKLCPFSRNSKKNETEILIACSAWFVHTCLRRATNLSIT